MLSEAELRTKTGSPAGAWEPEEASSLSRRRLTSHDPDEVTTKDAKLGQSSLAVPGQARTPPLHSHINGPWPGGHNNAMQER